MKGQKTQKRILEQIAVRLAAELGGETALMERLAIQQGFTTGQTIGLDLDWRLPKGIDSRIAI
jgi:hypothetical protein